MRSLQRRAVVIDHVVDKLKNGNLCERSRFSEAIHGTDEAGILDYAFFAGCMTTQKG
jgi:hypothetical protein